MNSTQTNTDTAYSIGDYYVVCSLSIAFATISITVCVIILVLVWRTKSRLHTVNHLLLCNTSIASIFYCVIINNNYIFLIFIPSVSSDISCRLRAYFAYISITGVVYSYLIQAISRLFFSFFNPKYRWLTTFKAHYCLIVAQWVMVIIVTSPAIVTNDIVFYPRQLCWVPLDRTIHLGYTVIAYYITPVLSIVIIYIHIYCRFRRMIRERSLVTNIIKRQKLDLELLRNILTLVCMYLGGGLPFLIFVLTSIKEIYLLNLVTLSFTVALEKTFTLILDRELRRVIRNLLRRRRVVVPVDVTPLKPRSALRDEDNKANRALQAMDTILKF